MAVGKLIRRTSLRDVVTGHVAMIGRQLAEFIGRAADPCMGAWSGIPNPAVVFTEVRHVGQLITGTTVDDRG